MGLKRITTKDGEVYFVDANTGERVNVDYKQSSVSVSSSMRFGVLLSFGKFFTYFGSLIVLAALIVTLIGIEKEATGVYLILGGIFCLLLGLLIIGMGQTITCFVSIEGNTYEMKNILKDIQPQNNDQ